MIKIWLKGLLPKPHFNTYTISINKQLSTWIPSTFMMLLDHLVSYKGLHNPSTNLLIIDLLPQLLFTMLLATCNNINNIFNHASTTSVHTIIINHNNFH